MIKNSKRLKKIRASVRTADGHLPVRGLDQPTKVIMVPDPTGFLYTTGLPKMVPFVIPLPAKNISHTQRAVYRHIKKASRTV